MIDYSEDLNKYKNQVTSLLRSAPISLWDANVQGNLTTRGGVYRLYFENDPEVSLYVGKSSNIRKRICGNLLSGDGNSHTFRGKLIEAYCLDSPADARDFMERNIQCQVLEVHDEAQRGFLEHFVIAVLKPRYNDQVQLD